MTVGLLHTWIDPNHEGSIIKRFSIAALLVGLAGAAAPLVSLPTTLALVGGIVASLIAIEIMWPTPKHG